MEDLKKQMPEFWSDVEHFCDEFESLDGVAAVELYNENENQFRHYRLTSQALQLRLAVDLTRDENKVLLAAVTRLDKLWPKLVPNVQ